MQANTWNYALDEHSAIILLPWRDCYFWQRCTWKPYLETGILLSKMTLWHSKCTMYQPNSSLINTIRTHVNQMKYRCSAYGRMNCIFHLYNAQTNSHQTFILNMDLPPKPVFRTILQRNNISEKYLF